MFFEDLATQIAKDEGDLNATPFDVQMWSCNFDECCAVWDMWTSYVVCAFTLKRFGRCNSCMQLLSLDRQVRGRGLVLGNEPWTA